MTNKEARDLLARVFTCKKFEDGEERIVFSDAALHSAATTDIHTVYETVSDAMHESGLTHGFSYEIGSRAVDVIVELEDWEDHDAISQAVDAIVPVYTNELMHLMHSDSWALDEMREEYGHSDSTTINDEVMRTWYMLINNMVHAIIGKLQECIEEEATI